MRALQQSNMPVESQDQTIAHPSSAPLESQGQSMQSAAGVIVNYEQEEALAQRNP